MSWFAVRLTPGNLHGVVPEPAGATPATLRFGHPRITGSVRAVLATLLVDRLGSTLGHVLDTPDLLYSAGASHLFDAW